MREFFKGWRRKVGCLALVMAILVTCAWVRSLFVSDVICFHERNDYLNTYLLDFTNVFDSNYVNVFASDGSSVLWLRRGRNSHEPLHASYPIGGDILERMTPQSALGSPTVAYISYPAIVIPLFLLSAYLLLWKPRTKEPT